MYDNQIESSSNLPYVTIRSTQQPIAYSRKRVNWCFPFWATILAAFGGLLFGYDTGVISGAMIQLREQFSLSYLYQELIVSITLGSAALTSILSASMTDLFGRKWVIIIASFVFTVGAVNLGVAQSREVILVGRLIVGIGIGMASMIVPIYIAEISPSSLRGPLVTLFQVSITFGQMIAAIVDGIFMFNPKDGWRYMLALGGVPSLIQMIGFLFMPETPRWLVQHGRIEQARNVLTRIHGEKSATDEVEAELNQIVEANEYEVKMFCEECDKPSSPDEEGKSILEVVDRRSYKKSFFDRITLIRMLRSPSTRHALAIGCTLQLFQQLIGINTVMYYSASIIAMAGVGSSTDSKNRDSTVVWLAAVVATVNFICCCSSPWLVSRMKRRKLLLCSLAGVFTSLVILGASFQTMASTSEPVTVIEPVPPGFEDLYCYKASSCDSCMRTNMCGYCYNLDSSKIVNGSCLPSPEKFAEYSSFGRCANQTLPSPNKSIWAFDYCPTPYGWLTVLGLVMYLASFAPGMSSLPWTINSELYPTWARSTGVALATGCNWIANIVISLSFLSLTEAITRQGAYLLYACITILAMVFVCKCIPETGDVSLEQAHQTLHVEADE